MDGTFSYDTNQTVVFGNTVRVKPKEQRIISEQFSLMLNTSCALGVSPIYWDKVDDCAKVISNPLAIARYISTISMILTLQFFLVLALLRRWLRNGFLVHDYEFMYYFLNMTACNLSILLHLHAAIRRHELVALVNGLVSFWKSFTGYYNDDTNSSGGNKFENATKYFTIMTKLTHHGLIVSCLPALAVGFIKWEFHVLAPILPTYETLVSILPNIWIFNGLFYAILGFLNFAWCFFQAASALVLFVINSAAVMFSRAAWRQLSIDNGSRTTSKMHIKWTRTYRHLQILSQFMNDCFSHDVWPVLIASEIAICSAAIPNTIKLPGVAVKWGNAVPGILLLVLLLGFADFGAKHYIHSQEFIKSKQILVKRKYLKKVYQSCQNCSSFRIKIGHFFGIGKFAVAILISVVIENGCTLLILAKKYDK